MTPAQERLYLRLASLGGCLLGACFVFVCAIVYQTFSDDDPPVLMGPGVGRAWQYGEDTVFSYERDFRVLRSEYASVDRRMECSVGGGVQSYDLPVISRKYKVADYKGVKRLVHYPTALPIGTQCTMITSVRWSPVLSMRNLSFELQPIKFVAEAKP